MPKSWGRGRKSKYGNVPTQVDNILFDSKLEATRYQDLKILNDQKLISNLQLQVPFEIEVNGKLLCKYIADFVYIESGRVVVEDAKGMRTPVFNLKWKLVQALHGKKYDFKLYPHDFKNRLWYYESTKVKAAKRDPQSNLNLRPPTYVGRYDERFNDDKEENNS